MKTLAEVFTALLVAAWMGLFIHALTLLARNVLESLSRSNRRGRRSPT